jgi:8-oxo-dGTP diphosphatase
MCVVSGLALNLANGRILMGKRRSVSKRPGLWETPGGKVEENETPQDALIREWREELDLVVTVGDWIATTPILDLETRFVVELYHVDIVDTGTLWKKLDHEDVAWTDPALAVERMPCSPAFYLHYPAIRAWLLRRRRAATP